MTQLAPPHLAAEEKPWVLRHLWVLLGATLVLRVLVDLRFSLVPDEAVYWAWSRHLALGYFDHPPMIAWINWLFSHLIGSTELGVRLPSTLLAVGTVAVIVTTARRIIADQRAAGWVAIIWLVCPLLVGLATISTPDTPAIFFSTCAIAVVLQIARGDDLGTGGSAAGLWMGFGFFCGLAFLSKYTTVLLPAGVILALLFSRPGRRHFARPWIYLAALLSIVIFSPVIWWNYRHGWASFLFQLHHGVGDDSGEPGVSGSWQLLLVCRNLLVFLGGQAMLWTPVLFIIGLVILVQDSLSFARLGEVDRILFCCAALPLVLFAVASAHKVGEANWPAFAYVPLSLLTGRWIARKNSAMRSHATYEGCKLALIFTVVLHVLFLPGVPRLLAHVPLPHAARDLAETDWRAESRDLAAAADGAPVVCNRHQDAAEASFYMPGQPDVWCDGVGSRPTAYDYFDVKPDFSTINRVLFVGGHAPQFIAKHGYTQSRTIIIAAPSAGPRHWQSAVMVSR
jgi:4-amino-4-deoxy-L-arabinose transferase-like glycosyltransferase